jgi:hypothetical protein
MSLASVHTIQDVIRVLGEIIRHCEAEEDPLGYFAVLYQKVTIKVAEGIDEGVFDDGPRMELLDVVFAKRYLEAYFAWRTQGMVTRSWQSAFGQAPLYWPIVLQHLLLGINAHINLDLGIAAAEVSRGKDIRGLERDFIKINEILSSLVHEVEEDLAAIWPKLHWVLRHFGKVDNLLVDFSMKIAREGAWKFALELAQTPEADWPAAITIRDEKVARNASIVVGQKRWIRLLMGVVRLGERGTVGEKIRKLQ